MWLGLAGEPLGRGLRRAATALLPTLSQPDRGYLPTALASAVLVCSWSLCWALGMVDELEESAGGTGKVSKVLHGVGKENPQIKWEKAG